MPEDAAGRPAVGQFNNSRYDCFEVILHAFDLRAPATSSTIALALGATVGRPMALSDRPVRPDAVRRGRATLFRRGLLCTTSLVALALLAATTTPSRADDTWAGATSTDWFTGSNWSAGTPPTSGDNIHLDTISPNPTVIGLPNAQAANIYVGYSNTGALTIQSGGTLSNNLGYIGYNSLSNGAVTVTGTGSSWINSSSLHVGLGGTGTLNIQNGGAVSNTSSEIGLLAGSNGTVTVDGAGSSWTSSNTVAVGGFGTGTVTIRNSAMVRNDLGIIGLNAGSNGTVTVDGTGSSWPTAVLSMSAMKAPAR